MFILLENLKKIQFRFRFFAGGEEKSIRLTLCCYLIPYKCSKTVTTLLRASDSQWIKAEIFSQQNKCIRNERILLVKILLSSQHWTDISAHWPGLLSPIFWRERERERERERRSPYQQGGRAAEPRLMLLLSNGLFTQSGLRNCV